MYRLKYRIKRYLFHSFSCDKLKTVEAVLLLAQILIPLLKRKTSSKIDF